MIGHGSKKGMTCAKLDALRDTSKVVTDYDGCAYITAGKEYDLIDGTWHIIDDVGDRITVRHVGHVAPCFHDIGVWYHPLRT